MLVWEYSCCSEGRASVEKSVQFFLHFVWVFLATNVVAALLSRSPYRFQRLSHQGLYVRRAARALHHIFIKNLQRTHHEIFLHLHSLLVARVIRVMNHQTGQLSDRVLPHLSHQVFLHLCSLLGNQVLRHR
jgi:hypothetical protein